MERKVYIAGAHSRGRTLKAYLESLYPETEVVAFLVDDLSENPQMADGVPVKLIEKGLNDYYPTYIATRGIHHLKITAELEEVGIKEIILVTAELDKTLRNEYVRNYFKNVGREFLFLNDMVINEDMLEIKTQENEQESGQKSKKTDARLLQESARIYVAKSIVDNHLKTVYELADEEVLLQVGAALTEERLPEALTDCVGENISAKNKQYCELTGLYWIWKHAKEDYIGLVHYRRHFLLPNSWRQKMTTNDVDVVLPVPLYVAPSVAGNYKERHSASDWDSLMEYFMKELPMEYEDAVKIFSGNLYSPCNMLIARREVLHELCTWLFPIVDAAAEHGGERCDWYENRYPGFIAERLITYFFEKHRNKYKVAYADKNFLS